jgi:hypothetical protein
MPRLRWFPGTGAVWFRRSVKGAERQSARVGTRRGPASVADRRVYHFADRADASVDRVGRLVVVITGHDGAQAGLRLPQKQPAIDVVVLLGLTLSLRIVTQYEKGVLFRLGRVKMVKDPGLAMIVPVVDVLRTVSLRIITMPIQSQGIITKDNVSVDVSAIA